MSLSIQTNTTSHVGQNTLNKTQNALTQSMERLSTGYRINSAADDAAGLQVANRLEAQSRGMGVAMRNAGDATSQMQTAEGALDEMTNIAYRMNDLATQANSDTASTADKAAMQAEFSTLNDELTSMVENTTFGGQDLFGAAGTFGDENGVNYQVGASTDEVLNVNISAAMNSVTDAIKGEPIGGSAAIIGNGTAENPEFPAVAASESGGLGNISTAEGAKAAMDALSGKDSFIDKLGTARSGLGANINRLDYTVSNLGSMMENTDAAQSRIRDTDMASESAALSKNQMLMQSGTQMLQQSKSIPQMAMSLL